MKKHNKSMNQCNESMNQCNVLRKKNESKIQTKNIIFENWVFYIAVVQAEMWPVHLQRPPLMRLRISPTHACLLLADTVWNRTPPALPDLSAKENTRSSSSTASLTSMLASCQKAINYASHHEKKSQKKDSHEGTPLKDKKQPNRFFLPSFQGYSRQTPGTNLNDSFVVELRRCAGTGALHARHFRHQNAIFEEK